MAGVHNLTSESQEVMVLSFSPLVDLAPILMGLSKFAMCLCTISIPISSKTAIPHSGQLNITNSILFTRI